MKTCLGVAKKPATPVPSATNIGTDIGAFSVARGISAFGQIVGQQNDPEPLRYVWSGTTASQLSNTNLGDGTSDASAINSSGEVVGLAQVTGPPLAPLHAVRWSNAAPCGSQVGPWISMTSSALRSGSTSS